MDSSITAIRVIVIDNEFAPHYALRTSLQKHYEGKRKVHLNVYQNVDSAFAGLTYTHISCVVIRVVLGDYLEDLIINLKNKRGVPIIILADSETATSRLELMNAGADIILKKNLDCTEYFFTIKNLLNLFYAVPYQTSSLPAYNKVSLRSAQREMVINEKPIDLTTKEYEVLQYLMNNSGRFLTVEQIYSYAWNDELQTDSVEKSVRDVIYRIRKKLNDNCEGEYIESKYGYGYRIFID